MKPKVEAKVTQWLFLCVAVDLGWPGGFARCWVSIRARWAIRDFLCCRLCRDTCFYLQLNSQQTGGY